MYGQNWFYYYFLAHETSLPRLEQQGFADSGSHSAGAVPDT